MKKTNFKISFVEFLLFALFLLADNTCFSQTPQLKLRGTVLDSAGTGMQAVSVRAFLSNQAMLTDAEGKFTLNVSPNETLEFTYVGYLTQQRKISDLRPDANGEVFLTLVMVRDNRAMDEVVVVGFGTQPKKSLVSSVTNVKVEELKTSTGNITNALAGRVAGMISFQTSGEPGRGTDNSQFYIRGLSTFGTGKQDPLILIDGIESTPTDMARLQPDDISDFSVLKDAAASAVYGARGANGVVLINTKSGKSGVTKFDFRAENRLSTNTKNFAFADNITYMQLANEATLTRSPNAVQPYTKNKINGTIAGEDPYLYPSNNWIDQLIKKYTLNQSYNLGLSGGTSKARYYIAGWYQINNGNLKVDPVNNFNNNIKLQNYSLRTNVNLNITSTTELIARMYGQFDDYKGPIGGGASTYSKAMWSNPVMFPAVYPSSMLPFIEHPLFGSSPTFSSDGGVTSTLYVNPYAEMVRGYSVYKTSNLMPQLELKQNLKFITQGLSFRSMAYVRRISAFTINRSYNPFYYMPEVNPQTQTYTLKALNDGSLTSIGTVGTETLNYAESEKSVNSMIWAQGAFDYSRRFNKHDVSGMVISYVSSYESGAGGNVTASLPQRNTGVSGRLTGHKTLV